MTGTKTGVCALALVLLASVALAHTGVQNPNVMARMQSMKAMGDAVKVVGLMVRGQAPFDAAEAEAAVNRLRAESARTHDLFRAPETDPRMEAVPALWDNWDDFVAKNAALEDAIGAAPPSTVDEARLWLARVGAACSACHEAYRD